MNRTAAVNLLAVWLTAVLYIASGQFADPDLWGRLSIAALFFQNGGHFPYHDVFSYTAPHARWIDHEWLSGMTFYSILAGLGEPAFLALKYGMLLAIFALLFLLHRRIYKMSHHYAFYGLLVVMGAYSVGFYATTRAHLFSFFFFVLWIFILEAVRMGGRNPRLLWLLPLLGFIWGNLHGGFVMGVLLMLAYGAGETVRLRSLHMMRWAGLAWWLPAVATFLLPGMINPYGPSYIPFLWHAWTLDRSHIGEWSAMKWEYWHFLPAQLLILAAWLLPILSLFTKALSPSNPEDRKRRSALITPALVLVLLAIMTMKSIRLQPFLAFGVVAYAPLFLSPDFLTKTLPAAVIRFFHRYRETFSVMLPTLLLLAALIGATYMQRTLNLFRVPIGDELTQGEEGVFRYPLGAIRYLERSPFSGNLATRFVFGEFAYWRLFPRFRVAMDGRYEEVYSQAEFLRNDAIFHRQDVMRAQKTVSSLAHDGTDFILMENTLPSLALLLRNDAWRVLYTDAWFTLLGRRALLVRYVRQGHVIPPQPPPERRIFTIGDMVRPEDLRRFRIEPFIK